MTRDEMKHELIDLGRSQTDLAREIESRYKEKMTTTELGNIMRGAQEGPKAERVRIEVEEILRDWSVKNENNS